MYRLPYVFWTKLVFTLQIGDRVLSEFDLSTYCAMCNVNLFSRGMRIFGLVFCATPGGVCGLQFGSFPPPPPLTALELPRIFMRVSLTSLQPLRDPCHIPSFQPAPLGVLSFLHPSIHELFLHGILLISSISYPIPSFQPLSPWALYGIPQISSVSNPFPSFQSLSHWAPISFYPSKLLYLFFNSICPGSIPMSSYFIPSL